MKDESKRIRRFNVVKLVGAHNVQKPYRIIETVLTSDGPRSRLTDGVFEDEERAIADMRRREQQDGQTYSNTVTETKPEDK